jgi:hypothetical protein
MGEYAVRISDNQEVKIGTCEDMFYLRFSDRNLVRRLSGNIDVNVDAEAAQCRFRLPFPDEDGLKPGEYDNFNRFQELYNHNNERYTVAHPETGVIQVHHKSGILINLPCYHGEKLPEIKSNGVHVFWNGKDPGHIVLSSLRCVKNGEGLRVLPVLRCKYCDHAWRVGWADIWEYIPYAMRIVLREYALPEGVQA